MFYWTLHARSLVLEHFNCASWEDLHENKSVYKLASNIHSMFLNIPNCPSAEAAASCVPTITFIILALPHILHVRWLLYLSKHPMITRIISPLLKGVGNAD
jgi:hypothetical protein